ncbi:MAG: polysaccharide biosynthesis/export family protein [Planctomycetota bacterium]
MRRPLRFLRALAALALGVLASCGSYEDKRIRELMPEKGFGARAAGDAAAENYIGGRDLIQFLLPPDALQLPQFARLAELTLPQPIAIDGTIFVPYVGPVAVLGKTEAEAAALVNSQLRAAGVDADFEIQARIVQLTSLSSKWFYAFGEVAQKGQIPIETDLTFFDAMTNCGWTPLANLGRVYLIKPDAEHPLVIDINVREMQTTGLMTMNLPIRERDIILVPPTFLGLLARLLQRFLEPIGLAVQTVLGIAQAQFAYDVIRGDAPNNALFFRF